MSVHFLYYWMYDVIPRTTIYTVQAGLVLHNLFVRDFAVVQLENLYHF